MCIRDSTVGGVLAGIVVVALAGWVARSSHLKEDTSLAAFYLISLALGVLVISLRQSNVDLFHVLFGNIQAGRLTTNEVIERADVKGDTLTGTPNINLEDNAVHYYTSNAGANWVFNFRGGVSTTLNSMLATGEVMTVALLTTQGSTAYYATGIQIDGVSQTVKWSNGTAPSAGTASSIEVYSFSIVKTGSAAYSVIGSVSDYS